MNQELSFYQNELAESRRLNEELTSQITILQNQIDKYKEILNSRDSTITNKDNAFQQINTDFQLLNSDYQRALDTISQQKAELTLAYEKIQRLEDELALSRGNAPINSESHSKIMSSSQSQNSYQQTFQSSQSIQKRALQDNISLGDSSYSAQQNSSRSVQDPNVWGNTKQIEQPIPKRALQDNISWGEPSPRPLKPTFPNNNNWNDSPRNQQPLRRAMQESNIFGDQPSYNKNNNFYSQDFEQHVSSIENMASSPRQYQPYYENSSMKTEQTFGVSRIAQQYQTYNQNQNSNQSYIMQGNNNNSMRNQLDQLQAQRAKIDKEFRQAKPAGMSLAKWRRNQEELEDKLDEYDKQISAIKYSLKSK